MSGCERLSGLADRSFDPASTRSGCTENYATVERSIGARGCAVDVSPSTWLPLPPLGQSFTRDLPLSLSTLQQQRCVVVHAGFARKKATLALESILP